MSSINELRNAVYNSYLADEDSVVAALRREIEPSADELHNITATCVALIDAIRRHPGFNRGLDAFMAEYSLDTQEGVRLMTLAEALARIPDEATKESLIKSKLTGADWENHLGRSLSTFVNSSTRALLFTSSVLNLEDRIPFLSEIIKRVGEPAIRIGIETGMSLFSQQFVLGEELEDVRSFVRRDKGIYRYSFDMLGEAALTKQDAEQYYLAYKDAITFAGQHDNASVSIKLSALHPRFDALQKDRIKSELFPQILSLVQLAKKLDVQVTIDAEESDRLELTLELVEMILDEGSCKGWHKLGVVVQTYFKRAMPVLRYLKALSEHHNERLVARLVKGAYWDSEIKHAQELGLEDYPVFTHKIHSDISFLACARWLLDQETIYPQFATHNVHAVATLLTWSRGRNLSFEFQRLHGMGAPLYDCLKQDYPEIECCVYAPIGRQKELLPYLIRRLLENSANSSFVNQLASNISARELSRHPAESDCDQLNMLNRPPELFLPRRNSRGLNPRVKLEADQLAQELRAYKSNQWHAWPSDKSTSLAPREVLSPVDLSLVGEVRDTDPLVASVMIETAKMAQPGWEQMGIEHRASILEKVADLLERNRGELLTLMAREAGKTLIDGMNELREAVDFCRYYAIEARTLSKENVLPGPDGERNTYYRQSHGVIACISPWNFPIAIFTGQIAAALVMGNAVVAKPAEQSTLCAYRVFQIFLEAGCPADLFQFMPGDGENLGAVITRHPALSGIVFTGSAAVALQLNRQLASREGAIIPLVAETGGQNVMIVDSSALPDQVVKDVIYSAFNSAGQRCSALRVLYLQDSCAEIVLSMLAGAVRELACGDPLLLTTDIGPLIDREAKSRLETHINSLNSHAPCRASHDGSPEGDHKLAQGHFLGPSVWELDSINELTEEHFGPVLHVIRYQTQDLEKIFEEINQTGFGLTLGIHSRNETMVSTIAAGIRAGNIYVNRNMIGAIVGSQPFGGSGLSGTGPKAGGPDYLRKMTREQCMSNNIAAVGGAIDLLTRMQS